ncbi:MAG: hypothetical protein AAB656_01100 [Patescibacteria group bacterium]
MKEIDILTALKQAQNLKNKSIQRLINEMVEVAIKFNSEKNYEEIIIGQIWSDEFLMEDTNSSHSGFDS